MRKPPTTEARQDGLQVYQTETGWAALAKVGRLTVALDGCVDEEEAVDVGTAALARLAKRRGVEPARVADRTTRRLLEALRVP